MRANLDEIVDFIDCTLEVSDLPANIPQVDPHEKIRREHVHDVPERGLAAVDEIQRGGKQYGEHAGEKQRLDRTCIDTPSPRPASLDPPLAGDRVHARVLTTLGAKRLDDGIAGDRVCQGTAHGRVGSIRFDIGGGDIEQRNGRTRHDEDDDDCRK